MSLGVRREGRGRTLGGFVRVHVRDALRNEVLDLCVRRVKERTILKQIQEARIRERGCSGDPELFLRSTTTGAPPLGYLDSSTPTTATMEPPPT
jgi:hypothetical protein